MQYLRKLYESVFGAGPKGSARVGKVLKHFQALEQELSEGMKEIKDELAYNQAQVDRLRVRIAGIKADNTELGSDFADASTLHDGLNGLRMGGR